jgi:hypothetical protein
MTAGDDNVTKLPVRFKNPLPEDRTLVMLHEVDKPGTCSHLFCTYIVEQSAADVECGKCGAKLNPMWVLVHLAVNDRRYEESQKRHQEEMKRLAERSRTKCEHCRQMTRISHR